MRHRRAERCLLRAEMALEAGIEDDARESLDEAERLSSNNPRVAALRAVLDARTAASAAAFDAASQATRRQRLLRTIAAAVVFVAVGVGAFWITKTAVQPAQPAGTAPGAEVSTATTGPLAAAIPAPAAPIATGDSPASAATAETAATSGRYPAPSAEGRNPAPSAEPIAGPPTPPPPAPPAARREVAPAPAPVRPKLPEFNPRFAEPRPIALPPSSSTEQSTVRESPAVTLVEPPITPPLPDTPAAAAVAPGLLDRTGERVPSAGVPVAERPAPSENAAAIEEPRVRAVLARYEAAYTGLNASAAQAVWPGVDERSLARAFDSLQSQRVSLGRCAVQVQGTTASANCSGSISWTPKVGGGPQTTARQWRFELHSGNGAWQITRADVR